MPSEAPWATQDPAHRRAAEVERDRRRRDSDRTGFAIPGQLALAHLRYIMAGEFAVAWTEFGALGAMIATLARLLAPSVAQNMEADCRSERAQITEWARVDLGLGNPQLIRDERVKVTRERLAQCVGDQLTEFAFRGEAADSLSGPSNRSRYQAQRRSQFSQPRS